MENRLYYRELKCYPNADESLLREIGKKDYIDLTLLPGKKMKEEFRAYILYRGTVVSLSTIQAEKTFYKQICMAISQSRHPPDSFLDWDMEKWTRLIEAWMLQNNIPVFYHKKSVYGTTNRVEAGLIRYLKSFLRFSQPEDTRPEQEKDKWDLDKLGIKIKENPIYKTQTISFTGIFQKGIREEVKKAIYHHLKYEKIATVKRELTSLRQFSKFLKERQLAIQSCSEIDRKLLEEYLTYKATNGSSGRSNSDDIIKLRSVIETVGCIYKYEKLEKLFINTDIPPEVQPEFRSYTDQELKRLNAHITKLDEQITRCLVIHQMLGTRISDTLTLRRDCLYEMDGMDMITIHQVKSRTFEKPISAELTTLIKKAISYSKEYYGEAVYIFVDEKDISQPLQYTTIKHKVLTMIQKEDLRDDEGNLFKFSSHMFRHFYGVKLTELHLDDWTIAKLLGHKRISSVKYYRKMSNRLLADESRRAREKQTKILLENLKGWEDEYEQIR